MIEITEVRVSLRNDDKLKRLVRIPHELGGE